MSPFSYLLALLLMCAAVLGGAWLAARRARAIAEASPARRSQLLLAFGLTLVGLGFVGRIVWSLCESGFHDTQGSPAGLIMVFAWVIALVFLVVVGFLALAGLAGAAAARPTWIAPEG